MPKPVDDYHEEVEIVAIKVSDAEIRECAIRLMEHAGTLDGGWKYRELREYEDDIVEILPGLLNREYKKEEET
jgi:hypothetical protein